MCLIGVARRQAVGAGTLPLPKEAPAGTFQGIVRAPWYNGELVLGGPAGAAISDVADMVRCAALACSCMRTCL